MNLIKLLTPFAIVAFTLTPTFADTSVTGAGSTFIYPILAKWAATYQNDTGISLNYQSIGSGGGIKQIEAGTVDFGATDKPLGQDELAQFNLEQFPAIMGGIVFVVNIPGVESGKLVLDGDTAAKLLSGAITNWNDPAIAALNPTIKLPDLPVIVVHRADGSGTTFNLTYYLNDVSSAWKDIGAGSTVEWPVGVGAKGNEGIANLVKNTIGAIGYVEYAYAKQASLVYTDMINKDGKTIEPSLDAFQASSVGVDWKNAKSYSVILANQPGETAWPMTATTWIVIHKPHSDKEKNVIDFFKWAYANGDDAAKALDYVPLPDMLVDDVLTTLGK